MILTCPACGTRYVVKDGAIPEGGRTVRCAQCKHSWHQDAETDGAPFADEGHNPSALSATEEVEQSPEVSTNAEADTPRDNVADGGADEGAEEVPPYPPSFSMTSTEDPYIPPTVPVVGQEEPSPAHSEETSALHDGVDEVDAVDEYDTGRSASHPLRASREEEEAVYSPYADDDDPEPSRLWPIVLIVTLVLIAAIAAALYFLAPPELKRSLGLAAAGDETRLMVQVQQQSRQQLASGNQLLEVSGLVINPTDEALSVPPLQAQLRALDQQVVYRWTIPPPRTRLGPGGSASFNSAKLDVPASAACLEVSIGTPREQEPCRAEDKAGA